MTERAVIRPSLPLLLACALAACDPGPASRADLAAHAQAARLPAELQAGGTRIHASLTPTTALNTTIAQRYGATPARDAYLLLVGVRHGEDGSGASLPARVEARAQDLRGVWQVVAMREVRSEGFIDYAGTVSVSPPDTLRFEISVQREGTQAPDVLRFSRDVFPPSGG